MKNRRLILIQAIGGLSHLEGLGTDAEMVLGRCMTVEPCWLWRGEDQLDQRMGSTDCSIDPYDRQARFGYRYKPSMFAIDAVVGFRSERRRSHNCGNQCSNRQRDCSGCTPSGVLERVQESFRVKDKARLSVR
jgi:hypothetical protein